MMNGNKKLIHNSTRFTKLFQTNFLFHDFNKVIISHNTVIIIQISINRVAFASVIITEDVKMLNFLDNHITVTPSHNVHIGENRSHTNNNQNSTRSTNAVIFAKAAKPKITHVMIK